MKQEMLDAVLALDGEVPVPVPADVHPVFPLVDADGNQSFKIFSVE